MTSRSIFIIGYVVLGIALLACQIAASRTTRVATFGEMTSAAKRWRVGQVLVLLAWWWVGFHVLARSSPVEP